MASKNWRLVVTELGSTTALSEVTVEAVNWMTALQLGRGQIGEQGGVPTGASCAVAPDGKVTIHDPVARRTYTVVPEDAKSFARSSPAGPRVPADSVPPQQSSPAPASPAPAAAAAPMNAPPPKRTVAYSVDELKGQLPQAAAPAPQAGGPAPQPAAPAAEATEGDDWNLLDKRDQDPTSDSPLRYRERTYVMAPGTSTDEAEFLLRERFAAMRASLEAAPPGKFFNLAVFDHRWEGRPEKPPIATLQWKDWRGEPHVAFPAQAAAAATSQPPTPRAPSAPAPAPQQPPPGTAAAPPSNPAPMPTAQPSAPPAPQPSAPPQAQPSAPVATPQPAPPQAQPSAPPAPQPSAPAPQAQPSAAAPAPQPAPQAQPSAPPAPQPSAPAPQAQPAASAPVAAPPKSSPPKRQRRTQTNEQDARLAHAFEASQDLFFLSTPAEGLDFVAKLLEELVPCEALSACLYDINTDEFRFVALRGPGADQRKGEAVPRKTGLMGASAEAVGVAMRVNDIAHDARFDPGVDGRVGLEAKNVLYMPLHHDGRLLGVLQLINRAILDEFTSADMDVLAYIGRQTGEFLYQSRIALKPNSAAS